MVHRKRRFSVTVVESAEVLAEELAGERTHTCCAGFQVADTPYYFLNDAFSEDGAQEYATVKLLDDGGLRQVESITFSWCGYPQALLYIRAALKGEWDDARWACILDPAPTLEAKDAHGRCPLCA